MPKCSDKTETPAKMLEVYFKKAKILHPLGINELKEAFFSQQTKVQVMMKSVSILLDLFWTF